VAAQPFDAQPVDGENPLPAPAGAEGRFSITVTLPIEVKSDEN